MLLPLLMNIKMLGDGPGPEPGVRGGKLMRRHRIRIRRRRPLPKKTKVPHG